MHIVEQDKNAVSNYWLDYSVVVGAGLTVDSVALDPDGALAGITVVSKGLNPSELTDSSGNTYPVGTVLGVCIQGGTLGERYALLSRVTSESAEIDDRTLFIDIVDK